MKWITTTTLFVLISLFNGCATPATIDTPYGIYYNADYIKQKTRLISDIEKPDVVYKTVYKTKWRTRYINSKHGECTETKPDPLLKIGGRIKSKKLADDKYTVVYTEDYDKLEKVYDNVYGTETDAPYQGR